MSSFSHTFNRHRKTLSHFPRWRDRALYVYGRILRRYSWPMPGRHSAFPVHFGEERHPFYLRLGSTDWLVLEEIFQNDEYAFIQGSISSATRIVDLGANVGFSLRYWKTLFPQAKIIAMEPDPENCHLCEENIRAAGMQGQVALLQAGVGDSRRQIQLVDSGEGEWAYKTEANETKRGKTVQVIPLAEVLQEHARGQKIDLLKCDIEGAEKELFADCRAWIAQVEAIVIELHPPYTLSEFMTALKKGGSNFEIVTQVERKSCAVIFLKKSQILP